MLTLAIPCFNEEAVLPRTAPLFAEELRKLMILVMISWCLISYCRGQVVPGWSSTVIVSCLIGGVQLLSLGVIGEYVGKIYLEAKRRPRYIVGEKVNCG